MDRLSLSCRAIARPSGSSKLVSRFRCVAHPWRVQVRWRGSIAIVGLGLALGSCVAETTVIGDDRARYACATAPVLEAPPWGCVAVHVAVTEPWGCEALAGSWVRFRREPSQNATIRITPTYLSACRDGTSCVANIHLNLDGPACTCPFGFAEEWTLTSLTDTYEVPLWDLEADVMLEPLGNELEVQLCTNL